MKPAFAVSVRDPFPGTFLAAFTVLCGCPTEYGDEDRCTAFLYNVLASFLQLLTALIVVGWVWSIMWGITFVGISSKCTIASTLKTPGLHFASLK